MQSLRWVHSSSGVHVRGGGRQRSARSAVRWRPSFLPAPSNNPHPQPTNLNDNFSGLNMSPIQKLCTVTRNSNKTFIIRYIHRDAPQPRAPPHNVDIHGFRRVGSFVRDKKQSNVMSGDKSRYHLRWKVINLTRTMDVLIYYWIWCLIKVMECKYQE